MRLVADNPLLDLGRLLNDLLWFSFHGIRNNLLFDNSDRLGFRNSNRRFCLARKIQ